MDEGRLTVVLDAHAQGLRALHGSDGAHAVQTHQRHHDGRVAEHALLEVDATHGAHRLHLRQRQR
jgi:hypothetical protein